MSKCIRKRYIDDIIVAFRGQLQELLNILNSFHHTIIITCESGEHYRRGHFFDPAYDFLDDGSVQYNTYWKTLCLYMFTPYASCHPRSIFKAIVSTEVHRLIITNSSQAAFSQQVAFIFGKFRAVGYPPSLLRDAVERKQWQDRPKLLDRLRRLRQQRGSRNPGLQGVIPFNPTSPLG